MMDRHEALRAHVNAVFTAHHAGIEAILKAHIDSHVEEMASTVR